MLCWPQTLLCTGCWCGFIHSGLGADGEIDAGATSNELLAYQTILGSDLNKKAHGYRGIRDSGYRIFMDDGSKEVIQLATEA